MSKAGTKLINNGGRQNGGRQKEKIGVTNMNYYDVVIAPKIAADKTVLTKNTIKEETSTFFLHTSFTALTQIYNANSLWKRVVWSIIVVAMLVWMSIQCYWLLEKYCSYPMEVQMDLKVSTVLEFPSVTICNLNPILQSKVKEEPYTPLDMNVTNPVEEKLFKEATKNNAAPRMKREATETPTYQNTLFNIWNVVANGSMVNYYDNRDAEYEASMTYAYITAKLNSSFVELSGHLKIDMIAACKFGGYQCSPMNFTYFHNHKYGNCYTFNSKFENNSTLNSRFPGPENGLRLELFLDQENYVTNLAPDAGARVLVHKKGSIPFPEDEGISIMPGRSTSVGIRQISFSRLTPPHGSCGDRGLTTNYYGKYLCTDYSKVACLKSCYQDMAIKYCNCSVPFYYVLDNVTVCNMTDFKTEHCVTNLPNDHPGSYELCDKLCPVPCRETKFEVSISTSTWPSDKYKPYFQERLNKTNSKYMNIKDINKEFTKLHIYFQDLIYEKIEQQKGYESMNLISDLGGQLGLWLGLSAITLGEIFSYLFGIGKSLWYECSWKKTKPIQKDFTPVSYIEPSNLQEMFEELTSQPAKYTPPDMTSSLPGSAEI